MNYLLSTCPMSMSILSSIVTPFIQHASLYTYSLLGPVTSLPILLGINLDLRPISFAYSDKQPLRLCSVVWTEFVCQTGQSHLTTVWIFILHGKEIILVQYILVWQALILCTNYPNLKKINVKKIQFESQICRVMLSIV